LDKVLLKYEFTPDSCLLLSDFFEKIDRKKLTNTIGLIEKCIECADPASDKARIKNSICPELD
jgi:hypothetical protein